MTDAALDVPQPQNPEAERAVLGSCLLSPTAIHRITGIVSTADFYKDSNSVIFGAMSALVEDGTPIDLMTLRFELQRIGLFDHVGGLAYLTSLVDHVPNIAQVELYAAMVAREAKKRVLVKLGNKLMQDSLEPDAEPEDLAAGALAALGAQATRPDAQARPFAEVLSFALEAQEQRRTGKLDEIALRSGYAGLDKVRAIKRSLVVMGAPSEAGKTCHFVNLWDGLASNAHPTLFLTLESTPTEVALRWASMKAGIKHGIMQDWKLMQDGDFFRLAQARAGISRAPMFISRSLRSIEDIYHECQRLKAMEGLDAVLIDYIQLVRMKSGPRDREERFAEIAQTMLEMSIDLGIGVIAASQVRDDWQKRDSGRLVKEDLKYARAIAETARVVTMFHRPRTLDKANNNIGWCEVLYQVEKNSENRTEDIPMHMNEATQRFTDGDCAANGCRRAGGAPQLALGG